MAKINFLLKSKNNPATIHVRFQNGKQFDLCKSTKLLTNPKCWDKRYGRVKNTIDEPNRMFINSKLKGLDALIIQKYMEDYTSGMHIDSDWLTNTIYGYYNQDAVKIDYKIYFLDFANKWLEECKINRVNISKGKMVTDGTLNEYKQGIETVEKYDKYSRTRTKFVHMDLNWHAKWLNFMTKVMHYSAITTRNKLTIIKMIIREAKIEYGIKVNPQFESKKFTVGSDIENEPKKVYLNEEKIKTIFNLEVTKNLKRSKDLLIIGCWTGLRVGDMMTNLKLDDMNDGIVDVKNKKTGKWVKFTLHPMVKIIITENNGKLPKTICETKFNKDIKEICKLAKFNEETVGAIVIKSGNDPVSGKIIKRKVYGKYPFHDLVTFHTCRRSFSSNLTGKIPDEVIMDIAGWSTKKMKEHYNKKEKIASAIKLEEYFNSEYGYLLESNK